MPVDDHVFLNTEQPFAEVCEIVRRALPGARIDEQHDDSAVLIVEERTAAELHVDATFADDPDLRAYRVWAELRDFDGERQDRIARHSPKQPSPKAGRSSTSITCNASSPQPDPSWQPAKRTPAPATST